MCCQRVERRGVLTQIPVVVVIHIHAHTPAVGAVDPHQTIAVLDIQGAQEQRIDEGEHGDVRRDPQRDG